MSILHFFSKKNFKSGCTALLLLYKSLIFNLLIFFVWCCVLTCYKGIRSKSPKKITQLLSSWSDPGLKITKDLVVGQTKLVKLTTKNQVKCTIKLLTMCKILLQPTKTNKNYLQQVSLTSFLTMKKNKNA